MSRLKDIPFLISIAVISCAMPQPAYAYIDPTSGSYALQAAMGTIFALMFYAKSFLNWIRLRQRSSK